MQTPPFHEIVGAILALVALLVVGYAAVVLNNGLAQGALIGVVASSNGFFLRGKVFPSNNPTEAPRELPPPI